LVIPILFGFSNAWADVSIQNDQQYLGSDGALHVVGEIQNHFDMPLNQIDIHVTLFSENEVIDTMTTNPMINTIMPGMKAPFDLVILGQKAKLVDSYSIEIDYKVTEPKSQVMDIISSKISQDNFNNLVITGIVTNRGDITANTIVIVATLYDKDGNVAAVSKSLAKPDYLKSNDEVFFLIPVTEKTQTNTIVDYVLVAESEEFAPVPEFPFGSLLLLAGSVSTYVILTRYASRSIPNLVCALNLR